MATNKIYYAPGSTITFRGTGGGDVLWTPQNIAMGSGRISDVWDRGAGALPMRYVWRCSTRWAATASIGDQLRLYLVNSSASADPTVTDGCLTLGDATLTSEAQLAYNCQFIGGVLSAAGADQLECASGICMIFQRYVALAGWNGSSSKALTNTVTDHVFTLTPIPDDIQAAT